MATNSSDIFKNISGTPGNGGGGHRSFIDELDKALKNADKTPIITPITEAVAQMSGIEKSGPLKKPDDDLPILEHPDVNIFSDQKSSGGGLSFGAASNIFNRFFGGGRTSTPGTGVLGGGKGVNPQGGFGSTGSGVLVPSGGSSSGFGSGLSMSSASPLFWAWLISAGKGLENSRLKDDPDDPFGNALLSGLGPSGTQIASDPFNGLLALGSGPFSSFILSDKAKGKKSELSFLFG